MRSMVALLLVVALGCDSDDPAGGDGAAGAGDGSGGGGGGGSDGGGGAGADGGGGMFAFPDDLETATGCDGPYNAAQVLTYHLTTGGSFPGLEEDDYGPGTFACGDEPAINVGVRPRAGGQGWRVDFNWAVAGQDWRTLKKIAFHTGEGGSPTVEYLGWRAHRLGGKVVQRSALARLVVDGRDEGILFAPEVVDKRFLTSRLGDDSGWLFKHSGSIDDGYRTNETVPNPYEDQWCIFDNSPCAYPADLETWLPQHLAIEQLMRMGAVNNFIGDSDGPIQKTNNFYRYDYAAGPRYYFPWDLDSAWMGQLALFPTGSGSAGRSSYHEVLFMHWEDDYDALCTALLAGPLSVASVHAEMDLAVAMGQGEIGAAQVEGIKAWYADRHARLTAEVEAH